MKRILITMAAVVAMLTACNATPTGGNTSPEQAARVQKTNDFAFLTNMGIDIEPVTEVKRLNDIANTVGPMLTAEQMAQLTAPLGEHFIEEMGSINLLAVRDIDGEHTLCFYAIHNGAGCDAAMATYDAQGKPCDAMMLRRCHELWPVNPETFEGNLARELTAEVEFNGQRHFNIMHQLQEMVYDPSTDERSAPQWAVKWHQDYDIDKDCHFVLKEQKEDVRTGNKSAIDEVVYMNMRLATFATQSVNDPRVIDQWNKAIPEWEQFYKSVDLSCIDSDLNALFDDNPVRFLQWMASHRGKDNHILPYFTKGEAWYKPSIEAHLDSLSDGDQTYIRSLIKAWEQ